MFADAEQKIIDRLRDRLGEGVAVHTLDEIERAQQLRQRAPAVFVVYDGYTIGEAVGNGAVQAITQDWIVVCAAKSAAGAGNSDAAKAAASQLCAQVLNALLGFNLGGGNFLKLADAPGPEYDGGYCHVPLAFQSRATFRGDPT